MTSIWTQKKIGVYLMTTNLAESLGCRFCSPFVSPSLVTRRWPDRLVPVAEPEVFVVVSFCSSNSHCVGVGGGVGGGAVVADNF